MNLLTVNFNLANLPDSLLHMFVAESFRGERLRSPLVACIQSALVDEESRRVRRKADNQDPAKGESSQLTLSIMSWDEICEAAVALSQDVIELERAIVQAENPALARQLRIGVEFLRSILVALKSQAATSQRVV